MGWATAVVLGVIAVVRLGLSAAAYLRKTTESKDARRKELGTLIKSFQDVDISEAAIGYIIPNCSNVDPSGQEDLRNTVGVQQNVFDALENELSAEGRRHILVLADSGMGKTTLLLNLVGRELKKPREQRKRIALIPLSQPDAIDQIGSIESKRDTILLLDAFDEDARAIEDAPTRMDTSRSALGPKAGDIALAVRRSVHSPSPNLSLNASQNAGEPLSVSVNVVRACPLSGVSVTAPLSSSYTAFSGVPGSATPCNS